MSMSVDYDVCVIGGGINGTGIARDAAGRGLSVLLAEARDLASATSSASSKLIHGGLRYLEHGELRLVRASLVEREVLMRAAPHIIWPLQFMLPHDPAVRPAWMIKAGLFLYDRLGGRRTLFASGAVDLAQAVPGVLKDDYGQGFTYADCWVEDSRLVVLNALDARQRGAKILNYTAVVNVAPVEEGQYWHVTLRNLMSGEEFTVTARTVVNAGGPWVRSVLEASGLAGKAPSVRLVKGSHIIVRKLHDGPQAFILQQPDKRIVFVLPYEQKFTLIGTTDVEYDGDPVDVRIEEFEREYLCAAASRFFRKRVAPVDILWSYSGVRPLIEDGDDNASKVTRDYRLVLQRFKGAPILSVFGGKLTTYRKLSEQAVDKIARLMDNVHGHWTAHAPLPGGDFEAGDFEKFLQRQADTYTFLPLDLLQRYAQAYGTRMDIFLKGCTDIEDLGDHYGDGLYQAEIDYLMTHELARTAEDILWRRSKLGLHVSDETVYNLESFFSPALQENAL